MSGTALGCFATGPAGCNWRGPPNALLFELMNPNVKDPLVDCYPNCHPQPVIGRIRGCPIVWDDRT